MAEQSRLEIVVDSRGAERNVRNVRNELGEMEGVGVRSLSNLRSAALLATGALAGIGVGVGFGSAIADIRDFSTEMSTLRAVSQASVEDMDRLERQARQLGATTAFGANQAAQAQRFLAQAGLEVNQVLGATPAALQLAQAGMLDLGEAADLATDIMAQMGLEVGDLSRINNVLVATAQSATTDVRQMGQAFSYAGPIADQFGVSLEETAAALGTISSGGVKASRAGTGLLGIFRQLANPSSEAAEALSDYNISLADVDIAARGIGPVLQTLSEAGISGGDAFKIFGSEAGAAAQILVSSNSDFAALTEQLQTLDGTAANMAKTMTDNLGGAFKGLGSAISETNLQMGSAGLTGGLRSVIDTATGVVQVFNGMQNEWAEANDIGQGFVRTVEGIAAAAELTAVAVGVRLATAVTSAAAAKVRSTAASVSNARAELVAAQATTRRTGAELASARAMLSSIRLEEQATRGTAAHAFALNSLSAARVRATNAAGAHATATAASAAAMGRASIAARAGAGAMALIGGPLGAAVIAGAGIVYFREELGLVPKAITPVDESVRELTESLQGLDDAAYNLRITAMVGEMAELERQAQSAAERIERLKRTANDPSSFSQGQRGDIAAGVAEAEFQRDQANASIEAIKQTIETTGELRESLRAADRSADSLDRLGETVDDVVAKFQPMLNQDVEELLERIGPGASIDAQGQVRDMFGNALPTFQRELEGILQDQFNAFESEQNLQAGLESLGEQIAGGVESALRDSKVVPTGEQDSAPGRAGPPNVGSFTIRVEKDGSTTEGDVQGDTEFLGRLADALSGVSSAVS